MSSWLNYVVFGAGVAVALIVVIKEYLSQEQPQQPNNRTDNQRTNTSASRSHRSPGRKCQVCQCEFAREDEFCIFLPCMHNQSCLDCGARLKKCVTCNRPIANRLNGDGFEIPFIPQMNDDDSTCLICYENMKRKKLNCGHYLCNACFHKLNDCPFCRRPITSSTSISI